MTDYPPDYWRRLGRNNKNRGRAFEKKVAEILGWTRVPYSGGSGAWGGGDVVDGFYKRTGYWFAECKTQQPGPLGNISVNKKWIETMFKQAKKENRLPVLVTGLVGASEAFVFIPVMSKVAWGEAIKGTVLTRDVTWETVARGNGGFCVQRSWIDKEPWTVARIRVKQEEDVHTTWYLTRLKDFAQMILDTGYQVLDG